MYKFLLFTTGGGSEDPLNWSSDEAALYSTSELKGMKPASLRSIDLFFETTYGKEIVTIGIKNSMHAEVMKAISAALNSNQNVITIADVDSSKFCSQHINSCKITSQETFAQTLLLATREKLNVTRSNYSSCLITNLSNESCTVDLHLVSQKEGRFAVDNNLLTNTGTLSNEGTNAATTSSVTLTVDGTAATSDVFAGERVYDNTTGTFLGVCTARNSNTEIVFGGGLESAITENMQLAVGVRYYLTKDLVIPVAGTLKLEANEISFDNSTYDLYAKVPTGGDAGVTFVFNY